MMIGASLTKSRNELLELVRYVRGLAKESSTPIDSDDDGLVELVQRPYRIAVVGGAEVGKTAFFEQVVGRRFDEPLARAGGVMIVRDIGHRVYVDYEKACKIHYQTKFRGLELIEFGNLGKMDAVQKLAAQKLLDAADFVFYLISAENPWDAATWDTIEQSHSWCEGRSALVMHKSDSRLDKDVGILQQHLRELCRKKLGSLLPHFTTSLKNPRSFVPVTEHLDQALVTSQSRRREIRMVYQANYALLRRCEQTVDDQVRVLKGDQEFLQSVEAQVVRFREQKIFELQERMGELGVLLEDLEPRVMRYLSWRTGIIGSLISVFRSGNVAMKLESFICKQLHQSASQYASEISHVLVEQCQKEWLDMRPGLEQRLSVDVAEFDRDAFEKLQQEFIDGTAAALGQAVVNMRLRRSIDSMVQRRHRVQQRIAQIILTLLIVSVGWGSIVAENALNVFTLTGLVLVAVMSLAAMVFNKRSQDDLIDVFFEAYDTTAASLSMVVGEAHVDRLRVFFTGFTPMFESIRKHIAKDQQSLGPLEKVAANLYLRLRAWESGF